MDLIRGHYGVMVGIGCGKQIHSREIPIDTAIYLKAADTIRAQESCEKGALVLADIDVPTEIVEYREERLRKILEVLGTEDGWDLIKQSRIPPEWRAEVNLSEEVPEDDKSYFKHEVQDAIILLRENGLKVGWFLDEKNMTGGEIYFDIEIARNRPDIRFIYEHSKGDMKGPSLTGIPLRKTHGNRKPPYLVKNPELHHRICLPRTLAQVDQEMGKITREEVSEAGNQRIDDFCKLIEKAGVTKDPVDLRLRNALKRFLTESSPS